MSELTPNRAPPLLSVRNLVVEVATPSGPQRIVNDLSFDVAERSVFSIVGESGSGKSISMLATMGLLPPGSVRVTGGQVLMEGVDLLRLDAREMAALRGTKIAMIFQDPMTSFNPVISIGRQIEEMITIHRPEIGSRELKERAVALLDMVGVPDPGRRYRQFPHEFSGGMRQRAMIAMAVANTPKLLIADEPTTALDVTIQAQVMEVLAKVREETGAAMVLVTHDLGLVAEHADEVGVMYGGRMMERADVFTLFGRPSHPYTVGLLRSLPRHDSNQEELYSIPGQPPAVGEYPGGCVFHPRCDLQAGRAVCATDEPSLRNIGTASASACHFAGELAGWAGTAGGVAVPASEPTGRTSG